jgi:hypothetical protein
LVWSIQKKKAVTFWTALQSIKRVWTGSPASLAVRTRDHLDRRLIFGRQQRAGREIKSWWAD